METSSAATLYTRSGRRKYVTPDERARFIAAAEVWPNGLEGLFCLTLVQTGCRISEGLATTPAHLDLVAGLIAFRTLKRRNRLVVREVPLPPTLLAGLSEASSRAALREDRLWPFSRTYAWKLVKAVMAQAGIPSGPHCCPKGLRHGFGVHAVRSSIPVTLLQKWLGHASLNTTMIYTQVMGAEEREIAARMW